MQPKIIFVCFKLLRFYKFRIDLGFSKSEGWNRIAFYKLETKRVGN